MYFILFRINLTLTQNWKKILQKLSVVKVENADTTGWPAEGAFTFIKRTEFHCSSVDDYNVIV